MIVFPQGSSAPGKHLAGSSVRQLRGSSLDARDIGFGSLCKTGTIVRVGLVEVREHHVLVGLVADMVDVRTERGHQVGFILLRQRTVVFPSLHEVASLRNRLLLRRAGQRSTYRLGLWIFRNLVDARRLVVGLALATAAVHGAILVFVIDGQPWPIDRQAVVICSQ